ncbi:phage tail spike protein [Staphylococcus equorum]|uniref:phage tail spike protein n=1 Tax=Staphylococcus equorum TaxID=246432 RepID=UPI001ED920E3|nr:phage tail spike protein [Staphylococcus equorum]
MIHLLNFKDEIIDFISEKDGSLFEATHDRQQKDKKETFDFTILSSRAKKFRERNRVITKDSNGRYREFIITGISDDMDGLTEIESNASYLEDIGTAKPFVPGKLENMTTSQALYEALRDTGWEVAPDTEYNGLKTTTWTEHKAPYDVALQLETTYDMELDFYIELGSNKVEHRYAVLKKPKKLFKGKEIVFGKDLTGLSRQIDFTEIKTALMVVGPEDNDGNTTEVIVTDDQAQEQFGLPQRYIWDVYKPESQNNDITESRLKALGENELDKIKTASVTYEISSLDIDYLHQHESTSIGDTIRVKDEDFNQPLYLEADVIGEEYDLLSKESVYSFGKVIRYNEEDLTQFFRQRLQEIRNKLNDDITNLNTQLQETAEYTEKYYEQKIIKQPEPPTNPVDDMLWYDTSNPDVAVLRRYRNGEWHNQTASDVQQLGGMTREETIYNELTRTFDDLQLQHSMLQTDVYEVINSQYLVDTKLKDQVQTDLDSVSLVFNQIKTNLDSMDKDTATIGKLIDTQAMFQDYRENLQKLNDSVQNAKISIDERLKLLQQQYTEEKFNNAMTEVAKTLPNGEWNSETGQLLADIPNQDQLNDLKTTVNAYVDGEIKTLNDNLVDKINTDITATKEELSASVTSVQEQVDGLEIGARNLLVSYADQYNGMVKPYIESTQGFDFSGWDVDLYSNEYINQKLKTKTQYTISYDVEVIGLTEVDQQLEPTELSTGLILFDKITNDYVMRSRKQMPREIGYTEHIEETFEMKSGNFDLLAYSNLFNGNVMKDNETQNETNNDTETTEPITDEQNTTTDTNTIESTTNDTTTTQEPTQDTTIDNTTTDGTTQEPVKTIEVSESDTIRITNLKLEKGTVATDWTPAPEDFQNELNSVSTSVEEQNTELSLMKDSINLKADKSTVTQQLGEVESKVQDNKAQLGIQADEINSKVSESKYTADQENVVNRLDNAETERQQLSTEINDRVTLSEYQNLNIGTRNLMLDTKERDDFIGLDDTFRYIEYQLTRPLTVGNEYTLSYEIYDLSGEPINQVSYLPYEPAGERKDVSVTDNKVVSTFKAKEKSGKMYLYKGLAGLTDPTKDFVIKNAMLVEGNKVGDYDKAPEQADTRLTEMETSISQNGEQIQDRVSLTEFNESNKTLSQVVSTLTQDTTNGLTYTFDENGKITNFNVGNDGVTIKGDSVDITVNDDFKVIAQDVDNKVDQDNIINRLNLSTEGLDIDVNNLGIRGGDNNQYLNIENDTIELHGSYTRTWQGSTDYNEVFTRLKDGHLRFRNNDLSRSIYLSDFGVSTYLDGDPRNASGTLEFFDYTYDSGARGVTLQSGLGVVALRADANRMVIEADDTVNIGSNKYSVYLRPFANTRVGVNEFQYYVKDNPTADATDGVLLYGNLTGSGTKMGSGIRFSKSAPVVYATNDNGDMGSGYFYGEGFQGDWLTKNTNLYACVQSNGSLRVTDIMGYNGGDPNYRDIEAMRLNTYHSYAFANHSGSDVYFGVGYNELRITANNWWNGGDTQYQNVRARTFYGSLEPNSSEKYKTNIENWNIDATQTLRDTKLYEYNYISDLERGEDIKKHGVILERETPDHIKGTDTIDLYEMVSTNTKALKEQIERNDELERKIKSLEAIVNG